jgi:branched-chain amino acid transport system ATP-binding protein
VLLVEHDVGLVMEVCASIHVIDHGALVAVGTPAEIRSNQAVLDAYLGDGSAKSHATSARTRASDSDDPGDAKAAPVLELRNIIASYGKIEVLHGVDVVLPRGKVVALLGPNGSGKSTALKVASGQMQPSSGCIHIGGRHVNGTAGEALSRIGLCTIPEGRGVFPNLTVRENLMMASYIGLPLGLIEERTYAFFPRLEPRRSQLAGTLSGGEQRMLAMARALVTEPGVLLLDEMSMGLAPLIVEELYGLVNDIADSGISILVVEQFAHIALGVADLAIVMVQGKIAAAGKPADIDTELSSAYLGARL